MTGKDDRDSLINAYKAARYTVEEPHQFTFHIDQKSKEIAKLFADTQNSTAAFMTAWNPLSALTPDAENRAAQRRLIDILDQKPYTTLRGFGSDPRGEWPGEESVLVLGITRQVACRIGRDFGQNALVWIGPNATPELIILSAHLKGV